MAVRFWVIITVMVGQMALANTEAVSVYSCVKREAVNRETGKKKPVYVWDYAGEITPSEARAVKGSCYPGQGWVCDFVANNQGAVTECDKDTDPKILAEGPKPE